MRQIANPHSEKRTKLILKQLEESDIKTDDLECDDEVEDEVSFIY